MISCQLQRDQGRSLTLAECLIQVGGGEGIKKKKDTDSAEPATMVTSHCGINCGILKHGTKALSLKRTADLNQGFFFF